MVKALDFGSHPPSPLEIPGSTPGVVDLFGFRFCFWNSVRFFRTFTVLFMFYSLFSFCPWLIGKVRLRFTYGGRWPYAPRGTATTKWCLQYRIIICLHIAKESHNMCICRSLGIATTDKQCLDAGLFACLQLREFWIITPSGVCAEQSVYMLPSTAGRRRVSVKCINVTTPRPLAQQRSQMACTAKLD